jgi:hypothetical protein
MDTATGISAMPVFICPLSACAWTTVQPPAGGTLAIAATEKALRDHLSGHDLTEWVSEVVALHDVMIKVAKELDANGRIGSSLRTGAMATRANLAAVECIGWIDHAIRGEDATFPATALGTGLDDWEF